MDVNEGVAIKEYFEEYVPIIFKEQLEQVTIGGMEGTSVSLSFKIVGDSVHYYGVIIRDAKDLEVKPGPIDSPTIAIELTEDLWRKAVTGTIPGIMDLFTDVGTLANRSRYEQLAGAAGTLLLDLERPGEANIELKVVFNNADAPQTTFHCSLETWVAIMKGELDGMSAFLGGKMKLDGDMMFAMSLNSLL